MLSRLPEVIAIIASYDATDLQRADADQRAKGVLARIRADVQAGRAKSVPDRIAVETSADDRLQGAATVMLWDTQTEEIVGNKVYDVEEKPKDGDIGRWESYTATFYGTALTGGS